MKVKAVFMVYVFDFFFCFFSFNFTAEIVTKIKQLYKEMDVKN